ncbi:MAG: hypothetical protein KZQ98_17815 [Candidatus Thiodiazotropha sp. (ex Lucinoma borealis)]|nr:hypothetical protein [Candidatus Thiodiazotropha sp. (ex Lucinoma borealis)]
MTMEELELMQRSLNGINGICEIMDFLRLYKMDLALREENPTVSHYIHMDSIDHSLGDALSALSLMATIRASNINVPNPKEEG